MYNFLYVVHSPSVLWTDLDASLLGALLNWKHFLLWFEKHDSIFCVQPFVNRLSPDVYCLSYQGWAIATATRAAIFFLCAMCNVFCACVDSSSFLLPQHVRIDENIFNIGLYKQWNGFQSINVSCECFILYKYTVIRASWTFLDVFHLLKKECNWFFSENFENYYAIRV